MDYKIYLIGSIIFYEFYRMIANYHLFQGI